MRSLFGRWLLAACLAAAGLAGPAGAAEDGAAGPLDRATLERRVGEALRDVINRGADVYNSGNPGGCYHVFYGGLLAVQPLLDHRPDLQKTITRGLARAERAPNVSDGAWELRAVIDDVRAQVYTRPPVARMVPPPEAKPEAKGATPPPPPKPDFSQGATLWDRLGREENLGKVVDDFMKSAALDPNVDLTRSGKYIPSRERAAEIKKQFIVLASTVSDGPYKKYNGKSMLEIHKGMGITDDQFEAFVSHMRRALLRHDVRPEDADAILKEVNRHRKDIVEVHPTTTLWDRLGGEENLGKVVDDFMKSAALDPNVDLTRSGKYIPSRERAAEIKKQFIVLASTVSDGPYKKYNSKSMLEIHKGMGITDDQFDHFVGHMRRALLDHGVRPADADAILKEVNRTRKDIVEVKKPGPPAAAPDAAPPPESKAPRQGMKLAGISIPAAPTPETTAPRQGLAAPAGVVDKLLPDDTETVVSIKVKQILNSPLGMILPRGKIEEAIRSRDEVARYLQDVGFDPLKDLDSILYAGASGNEPDKGLVIVHGKFDVKKFRAKAEEVAKDMKDVLKIHKVPDASGGTTNLYEVNPPGQDTPLFVALPSGTTMVASAGKDYVLEALDKEAGRKTTALKNKDLAALLSRIDTAQSMWMAVLGSTLSKSKLSENPDAKEVVDKITDASGGIHIDKDVKVRVSVTARTADDAKDLDEKLKDGLNTALGAVALLAGQKKELAPLVDVLKNAKPTVKDKVVSVELEISGKDIEKAIDKNKD